MLSCYAMSKWLLSINYLLWLSCSHLGPRTIAPTSVIQTDGMLVGWLVGCSLMSLFSTNTAVFVLYQRQTDGMCLLISGWEVVVRRIWSSPLLLRRAVGYFQQQSGSRPCQFGPALEHLVCRHVLHSSVSRQRRRKRQRKWRKRFELSLTRLKLKRLECGPLPNMMVALPNIGGALCSTPQSLADAHYLTAVQ